MDDTNPRATTTTFRFRFCTTFHCKSTMHGNTVFTPLFFFYLLLGRHWHVRHCTFSSFMSIVLVAAIVSFTWCTLNFGSEQETFCSLYRFDLQCINLSICTSWGWGWRGGIGHPPLGGHYRRRGHSRTHTFISIPALPATRGVISEAIRHEFLLLFFTVYLPSGWG